MQHYRKDIEGLRSLAVILVILYHYQFAFFSGGFVGVDVFFVISGFVITELLCRNLESSRFTFSNFYTRRILRLVPAFLVVSVVSFLSISPFYMDSDYYFFSKNWMASLIGLSNIFYFQELSEYFSVDTQIITLLHTWSLAVEEQFYLLWPALLLFLYKLKRPVVRFAAAFVAIWAGFFLLSIYLAEVNPKAAYYLLPARIFELMLGVGLSLYKDSLPGLKRGSAEVVALVGLALILLSSVLLTKYHHFPGYNALWPTLGAALIIYAGLHSPATLVARLFSFRFFVFLGSLSYSLYLWHWPPIALLNYQLIEPNLLEKLALVLLVFFASWMTHVFVENVFRYKQWSFAKTFWTLIFIPLILIWLVQLVIRTNVDISFRIPQEKRELYNIMQRSTSKDLFKDCFKGPDYQFDQSASCIFGPQQTADSVNSVLIGDSHAMSQIGFVETLIAGTGLNLLLVTRASTPFIVASDAQIIYRNDEGRRLRSEALTQYLAAGPKTVFIGAKWQAYLHFEPFEQYFVNAVSWLIEKQHTVYILEDVPLLPSDSFAFCMIKTGKECTTSRKNFIENSQSFFSLKQKIQALHPQVRWIDPSKVLCDDNLCNTVIDGIPLYRDESHLNYVGAKKTAELFIEQYGNPVLQ